MEAKTEKEGTIEITRSDLFSVFSAWHRGYMEFPEAFDDIKEATSTEYANCCADLVLAKLKALKSS
tara:strand:- start:227 stop:424 length:198 start_codon:yes stop_codon:yes gene_type:complete